MQKPCLEKAQLVTVKLNGYDSVYVTVQLTVAGGRCIVKASCPLHTVVCVAGLTSDDQELLCVVAVVVVSWDETGGWVGYGQCSGDWELQSIVSTPPIHKTLLLLWQAGWQAGSSVCVDRESITKQPGNESSLVAKSWSVQAKQLLMSGCN